MLSHKCKTLLSIVLTLILVELIQLLPKSVSHRTKNSIATAGYPVETHQTVTTDGYILIMFRIPGSPANRPRRGKSVVFLMHGMLCSSDDWIVMGPGKSLPYLLADSGFDVWLGNTRGNTYSWQHISLDPSSNQYWNFSWHEMGLYDAPAMIDYALLKTGQTTFHFVGHSQGNTVFFVMASLKSQYNAKIRSMHAFAPTVFLDQTRSLLVKAFAPFINQIDWIARMLGVNKFLAHSELIARGGGIICNDESPIQEVCANVLFLFAGYDSTQLNRSILPDILAHTPAGASVKQLVHYGQCVNSSSFRQFDYGPERNRALYGSSVPPNYPLKSIIAPVFLHYGDNDKLTVPQDVRRVNMQLGNSMGLFRVPFNNWNHLDFIYGSSAKSLLYDGVIDKMVKLN